MNANGNRKGANGQNTYRLISWLLSPAVFAHLLWRSAHDGGWVYFKQRLGFAQPKTSPQPLVWVHAASVGEINTAVPLLRGILARWPGTKLLVTTNTPTGRVALTRHNLPDTQCVFLPLDYRGGVQRFFRQHHFRCGIIVETEVWPMLYQLADTPLVIVNGRLSQRTLRVTESWFKQIFKRTAENIHTVLARSPDDARGFEKIGVPQHRVRSIGNLKYALPQNTASANATEALVSRPYCLLASTHADEELEIAKRWLQHPHAGLLVIAPRHPDRSAVIVKQLTTLDVCISVRSRRDPVTNSTRLYLADTLGEMSQWFLHASDIFMGGSLVAHGGHNMLEPAQLGKSVITGPHTHNFTPEVKMLRDVSAIREVNTAKQVVDALMQSVDMPEQCAAWGQRALEVIKQHQHITDDYLEALAPFLSDG